MKKKSEQPEKKHNKEFHNIMQGRQSRLSATRNTSAKFHCPKCADAGNAVRYGLNEYVYNEGICPRCGSDLTNVRGDDGK